jgi:2-isopropylmalate synthase
VAGIRQIAVDAAKMITDMAAKAAKGPRHGGYRFEYSPESFTGTELEVALEICNAVIAEVQPTPRGQVDHQLAVDGGNVDAQHLRRPDRMDVPATSISRDSVLISLHPHNDRGTGVAAARRWG